MSEDSSGKDKSATEDHDDKMPKYLDFPPEEQDDFDRGDCVRTVVSFFGVALVLHSLFGVIMASTQDLLGGTNIPTAAVLLSHLGSMALVMYTIPWFMQKLSYFIRVMAVFLFMASGSLMIIFLSNAYAKLVGVALNAVAHSLGEATFLALGAFYGEISVTSFSAGSGVGILIGPLYYLGLTSGICISPQETVIIISFGALLLLVFYYILNKDRVKSHAIAATYHTHNYTSVPTSSKAQIHDPSKLHWSEKCTATWKIFPLMFSMAVMQLFEYLTMHSVFSTLAFSNGAVKSQSLYVYYVSFYGAGEFVGRSYLNWVFCCKPVLSEVLAIYKTWIPTLIAGVIFALSMCIAWFRFVENVYLIMFLSFMVGLLSGVVYSNTMVTIQQTIEPRYAEFCLGLVSLGNTTGALVASFLGLWIEPILRRRCVEILPKAAETCFTRHPKRRWTQAICDGKPVDIKIEI